MGVEPATRLALDGGPPVHRDAAAAGSLYRENRVGSLSGSLCACFSFHAIKNVTCGEGGALLTNADELADIVRGGQDSPASVVDAG